MSTLQVRHLCLQAGLRTLVLDLSFDAAPGQLWCVLGPNGCGKSTLLHALAGVRNEYAGSIAWQARRWPDFTIAERGRHVALLPQRDESAFWGRVRDYAMLGRYAHQDENSAASEQLCDATLRELGLWEARNQHLHTLSGGEWQRANLAQLFLQDAPIMCLDEPLHHLDPRYQLDLLQRCAQWASTQRRLIFMVLHDTFWALRFCDHALLMFSPEEIVAGPVTTCVTRENLARLYGVNAAEFSLPAGQ